LVGLTKFIWLFGFFLAFLHAKIICTKMTYHPFSTSYSFKKNVFWSVTFDNISAAKGLRKRREPQTGKSAEHGGHVTRPGSPRSGVPGGETAMDLLSNKWKASYNSNRKYSSKWEETFVWVQKDADGLEAAYCKLCHCNILPRISSLSNHEKSEKHKRRTPLHGQTRLNVRKTPGKIWIKLRQ
jgi:hypothetical protein